MQQTCFICGGRLEFYLKGEDYLYQTSTKKYDIYKCPGCGLERIQPLPSEEEIGSFYPAFYYSYNIKKKKGPLTWLKEKLVIGSYAAKSNLIRAIYIWIQKMFLDPGFPLQLQGSNNFSALVLGRQNINH